MKTLQAIASSACAAILAGWAIAIAAAFFPPLTAPCVFLCIVGALCIGFGLGRMFEQGEGRDDPRR